jgi:hypothetical protein
MTNDKRRVLLVTVKSTIYMENSIMGLFAVHLDVIASYVGCLTTDT